jgi:hydroxyacylglutathione hydrolase
LPLAVATILTGIKVSDLAIFSVVFLVFTNMQISVIVIVDDWWQSRDDSKTHRFSFARSTMRVVIVEVNADNLAYLIIDEQSHQAWAVDPAEPAKLVAAASREEVQIAAILTTHHHADHAGGNAELQATLGGADKCAVIGGSDKVQAISRRVVDGDELALGSLRCTVRSVPFHTQDSVFYVVRDEAIESSPTLVFTGDSLFAAGAGRFFEGTAQECDVALNVVFKSLPDDALVYFGHEYTVANAKYALTVDPNNEELQEVLKNAVERREAGLCTAPTTVGREKRTNPFLRCDSKAIQSAVGGTSVVETLDKLRTAKNSWRGN